MTEEPATQSENETVASELVEEPDTAIDTDVTEDATTESGQISPRYRSTDHESETNEDTEKRPWTEDEEKDRETKSYADSTLDLEVSAEQKTATSDVAKLLEVVEKRPSLREYFPFGGFQVGHRARTTVEPGRRRRISIWRSLRTRQPVRNGALKKTILFTNLRYFGQTRTRLPKSERRNNVFRDQLDDDEDEFLRQQKSDFANRKELCYVRVPPPRPKLKLEKSVDHRAAGNRPGLVNGDYVIVELRSPLEIKRIYAIVVLRGMRGMHLLEMTSRERRNTWKFCFYQAIVALLAKTQLRYKYMWSANIDYIYDHAWMLFTHMGTINVQQRQRLDDVVVYNYRYSVEIELADAMPDVAVDFADTMFTEDNMTATTKTLSRKDPLQVRVERLGCEKQTDAGYIPVHKDTSKLEEWLGKVIERHNDCILRTIRFSLAFWRDGLFWYLYNPYRCDEYGFWNDDGHACIVKFCTADSLRRHLMILMLRGHAYDRLRDRNDERYDNPDDFIIHLEVQIYNVTFHCCQLDNLKLLRRSEPSKQPRRTIDARPSDSLEIEEDEEGEIAKLDEDEDEADSREPREKAVWLKRCRETTWGKYAPADRKRRPDWAEVCAGGKARWHEYYVEERNRLFSLWGEVHITDGVFDEANRGMQAYACYVVCAGMTRLMAPEYWTSKTLDTIVVCGDRYYARSRHEAELRCVNDVAVPPGSTRARIAVTLSPKYLTDRFKIGEILFEARMLPAVRGRLYVDSDECLWRTLERVFSSYHFAVLTCDSVCLGLFKFCGAYYVCDVNSFGPPLFPYGRGAAYLLRATFFRKFVTVLVLIVGSPERSRFSLNPIEILRIVEMDGALESCGAKTRERRHRFKRMPGRLPCTRPIGKGKEK
ncbi:uncharacterized protein LOC114254284 [Monomorium pharaonis]|uniref:uncharacterized protein LOC114254284 n=1 Tax=Monomorium pharaonis TaxID=307658 RepID=UPI0017460E15|nr:uncharacterized protein LOC114254284 [Monomorium pharaonis]